MASGATHAMSLTSMLKHPITVDLFKDTFNFRQYRAAGKMVAPRPDGGTPGAVGIAFDYLVRFWLEHRHPAQKRALG